MSVRIRKRRKGERREASSWRDVLKIHPAAELFPGMADDELGELGADIKAHGLKQPIVSWSPGYVGDGVKDRPRYVLDGISRLDAMELAGLPLVSDEGELTGARFDQLWEKERVCSTASGRQIKPGTDPYAYVISANIRRRHLTAEQKRELIAKLIKATPEKSDRAIAKTAKVDHKTVGAVRDNLEARGEVPTSPRVRTPRAAASLPVSLSATRSRPREPEAGGAAGDAAGGGGQGQKRGE